MSPTAPEAAVARMMGAGLAPASIALAAAPTASTISIVSPAVLTSLIADQRLVPAAESLPVAGTQSGNLFEDRNDAALRWYLPAYELADPDAAFAFAAAQDGVDQNGNPFNRATLTFDLRPADPPDVAQARAATPGGRFQPVPVTGLEATLSLPFKDGNGADAAAVIPGAVTAQPDGALRVVTSGLLGPQVIQAFESLRNAGGALLDLGITYQIWRHIVRWPHRGPFPALEAVKAVPIETLRLEAIAPQARLATLRVSEVAALRPADAAVAAAPIVRDHRTGGVVVRDHRTGGVVVRDHRTPDVPSLPEIPVPDDPPPIDIWTAGTARAVCRLPLGTSYGTDPYRARYTIAVGGAAPRPIIDVNDLRDFDVRRSEFRELTSLGNVQAKYPSFQRLYYGQVTGTVVAVPAAYGIVRGSAGTAARLDAVVDDSPDSISGCRFTFTFTLAPVYSQTEFAQLIRDVLATPEAAGRSLQVTLPTAIDPRDPGTLASPTATSLLYADSPEEHSMLLAVEFADTDQTPAVVNVNAFLNQLAASRNTPLFGQLAVRLDDVYAEPVRTSVLLNLHATSGTDDVAVSLAGEPPAPVVTNLAPFALRLRRLGTYADGGLVVTPFDQELAAGASLGLPVAPAGGAGAVLVDRELALPDPLPKAALFDYLEVETAVVQEARHVFTVNATAIDFAAAKVKQIDARITLEDRPALDIPVLTLTPAKRVATVTAGVPVDAVLEGLSSTLTLTITDTAGATRALEQANDFLDHPIHVITTID